MAKSFLYQNKKIVYRVAGTGNPVILVHGFGEDGSAGEAEDGEHEEEHLTEGAGDLSVLLKRRSCFVVVSHIR